MDHIELKFSIVDTGIGISSEGKEKLFKAFSQLDSSSTRKYGGTGLGLAIAKNLCNLMEGDIGVMSKLNIGSVFWFTAHLKTVTQEQIAEIAEEQHEERKKNSLRVLLVEDNLLNQKFATATLQQHGHQIDIAENGKIALDMYKKNEI